MRFFIAFLLLLTCLYGQTKAFIEPEKKEILLPVFLDLVIPGYGTFSQKQYLWAGLYAGLKISGMYLIYFTYQNYIYRDSLAKAAEARQAKEYDRLLFQHPRGDFLTAQQMRNEAQTAYTLFLYAVLAQGILYSISALHTYQLHYEHALNKAFSYEVKQEPAQIRHDLSWKLRF